MQKELKNALEVLDYGLNALNISMDSPKKHKILDFIKLLQKWNSFYNLTAIKDFNLILSHHIFDSLSILKYCNNQSVIADIGTGAGFPGVPLAIASPDSCFTLFDCNNKKASFLEYVILELKLPNITIQNVRIEEFFDNKFDILISRAFSQLDDFVKITRHLINKKGFWIVMKGVYPYDEISKLPDNIVVCSVDKIFVPNMRNKQRHVVIMKLKENI